MISLWACLQPQNCSTNATAIQAPQLPLKNPILFQGYEPLHMMLFALKHSLYSFFKTQSWYFLTKDFPLSPQNRVNVFLLYATTILCKYSYYNAQHSVYQYFLPWDQTPCFKSPIYSQCLIHIKCSVNIYHVNDRQMHA